MHAIAKLVGLVGSCVPCVWLDMFAERDKESVKIIYYIARYVEFIQNKHRTANIS